MTQHGTRLRIDAWLPMEDMTVAECAKAATSVQEIYNALELHGFVFTMKDRVTSRREKPR